MSELSERVIIVILAFAYRPLLLRSRTPHSFLNNLIPVYAGMTGMTGNTNS